MSELLRFATAGSVDDGKSTLIGRLLHDSKGIFEDQLESVERVSTQRGLGHVDLALLTDGLRAEREQGITIDVAYRYFATPRRKFIIADTPGHIQYTRNMVTGASTADVALILIDVRNGVVEQSRRHAFLASLLRVPHLVVCINKMDLVDYDREAFERVRVDFTAFAAKLDVADLTFIPVSALNGDNVVNRSANMPWYEGAPLLSHLEEQHIASDRNLIDTRFPVQRVAGRHLAGTVAGGSVRPGDEVVVLPSGARATIAAVETMDGPLDEAVASMAVTVRLSEDVPVQRGDVLSRPDNRPAVDHELEAMVCWMTGDGRLESGRSYTLKHLTSSVPVDVGDVRYRLDVNTLHRDREATSLGLNEIGRVRLRTARPIAYDEYRRNRATGSFILIDDATNATVGAGMLVAAA
jgi:bifunctional enzyme CysN/CysC